MEIELPEQKGNSVGIDVTDILYAYSSERGVRFHRQNYTYSVTTYFGGKPPIEFDHLVVGW